MKLQVIYTAIGIVLPLVLMPLATQAQNTAPQINISGATGALEQNIRAHIGTPDARCQATQRTLNRLLPTIRRDIERAAQALGYYRLSQEVNLLEAPSASAPDAAPTCWQLNISLVPGEPVRIGDINISITRAEHSALFAQVLAIPVLQRGQALDHSQYERLKAMISSHAIENGFFSARFVRSELSVDLENQQANVELMFDPGERYRFGQITISPLDDLSEGFLSRFLTFEPGDQYASEDLIKLRQNYNNSQYFNQIAVTPQFSQVENQQIPVTVDLVPRARRAYSTGAGVSTDNGPRFRLNYEDRYINRRGHRLNGDLAISTLLQEPSVSYVIPLHDPVNDSLRIATGFQRQETDSYISSTMRAGVTWRSLVWDNWVQNVFLNYQSEKAELTNVTAESRNIQTRTNSTISGVNLARTRTDDPIYPTNGWRLFAQASGSHESLLSDISFAQLYGSAKMIRAIGPGRLLLRAEIATTVADELLELPVSVRFFTGGDQSVRGFQFGELGDTNDLGEVVGGKHLLVGSIEYDYRIYGGWSVAAFVDTGNSFRDFGNMALKESAGLGVRWLSPIGPIRFDVAKGLDSGGFRFHITMGPDL
ncbi:MAG: autotransporter assembly complex family protein [Pseudohongiella sp.]|nr:autotransporter assembly complex family protein [Pseudohongiella sp.]